ncbi:KxYKxGKxW signal peptide domain-containing protein [Leuconostoc pseudomesenteroides]|uniref:KxYKxGKxW signal peptide domain-containing protein n=1 Tax=Leuconostoc pseudomesenteroides TaxID=33968 RepID=UPI0032DF37B9
MEKRYKLYKDGKKWVVGAIAVAGMATTSAMTTSVSAHTTQTVTAQTSSASSTQTDATSGTTDGKPVSEVSTATEEVKNEAAPTTSEFAKSDINTNVASDVTQDAAKQNIDKAQETVKGSASEAEQAGVKVTQGPTQGVTLNKDNAADKSKEVLTDLNQQDAALKQATATQKENEAAKDTADQQRNDAVTQGQSDLQKSHDELNTAVEKAQQAGVKVSVALSEASPEYKSLKVLTGQALLNAMADNIKLYQQSVNESIAKEDTDTKLLNQLTAEYTEQVKAYNEAKSIRDTNVSQGQSNLQHSNAALDEQINIAKQLGIDLTTKTSNLTPKYINTLGLVGQKLLNAMQENIKLYAAAVQSGTGNQNQSIEKLKAEIEAYKKADADYHAGVATNTGVKWQHDTYVTAGNGSKKMNGDEKVVSFGDGSIKTAGMYATQGNYLNQNTDANFDSIFKINGTGSIVVHNTTNGNVTLTFSNINSPYNTGTYVAVWGADDGGIAWSVFATYTGASQGGAGESGGGSASIAGGNILNYVHSYDGVLEADGNISVVTFNDLDNNQSVSVDGLNGQATAGKNVSQNGNTFSAGPGDVSQGSNGQLSSNGVRWVLDDTGHVRFTFHHATSDRNDTSIVAGAFGVDSQIPKEPVKPRLSAEKIVVDAPQSPDMPKVPEILVTKHNVIVLPEAETPEPQEVTYHLYEVSTTPEPATPNPEKPQPETSKTVVTPTTVSTAPVAVPEQKLPETGAENYDAKQLAMAGLAATIMSIGLVTARRKYQANDTIIKPEL